MSERGKRTKFRARYNQVRNYLLKYSRGYVKDDSGKTTSTTVYECKRIAKDLGFLKGNDKPSLTSTGLHLVEAYRFGNRVEEVKILRDVLGDNYEFRRRWAWVCEGRDEFKSSDLVSVFKKIGYDDWSDQTLKLNVSTFLNWVKSAELVRKVKGKGHTYRIDHRMPIGAKNGDFRIEASPSREIVRSESPEEEAEMTIFKLNAYICDYLADSTHEGDLNVIRLELENLRDTEVLDDFAIETLEREIDTALKTKSKEVFTLVANSLKSLRDTHFASGDAKSREL